MVLQGRQAHTRLSGFFAPFRIRGCTKSTVMMRKFSKLDAPSRPQYRHRYWSRCRMRFPSSDVRGLTRRASPRELAIGMKHLQTTVPFGNIMPPQTSKEKQELRLPPRELPQFVALFPNRYTHRGAQYLGSLRYPSRDADVGAARGHSGAGDHVDA